MPIGALFLRFTISDDKLGETGRRRHPAYGWGRLGRGPDGPACCYQREREKWVVLVTVTTD